MRGRPDIQPVIEFLSTRVYVPNENDRRKLVRLMNYPKYTVGKVLILEAENTHTILWYVNVAF